MTLVIFTQIALSSLAPILCLFGMELEILQHFHSTLKKARQGWQCPGESLTYLKSILLGLEGRWLRLRLSQPPEQADTNALFLTQNDSRGYTP